MRMKNITLAKTKATVFGTKGKGTPQSLLLQSKTPPMFAVSKLQASLSACLHNLLPAPSPGIPVSSPC